MSKPLVKASADRGQIINVTPETAGWTYVGFDLHKLAAGESVAAATGEREACLDGLWLTASAGVPR
jgi:5-deoxy-glucuronate isomerase